MADLVHGPIAIERLLAEAARPDCGAIVLFLGTTRDHHEGHRVVRLAYEAYEPMAREALGRFETGAVARHGVARCHIVHRLGEVPAGEASVAVIVSAEHRGPAFECCRWAMDEVKRGAPIWKKEFFEGGDAAWVEGTPLR
ncbi:MAG TPA: molybdenum cofactor biosynthesis protein MoaE [Candidatus Eisenbacteria bacterium]